MISVVFMVTVALVVLILLARRGWGRKRIALRPQRGIPRETLALEAFMQGNAYLAAEKFTEATAAFQRARDLDPKCLHVADRLAEVERRQHAGTVTLPVTSEPQLSRREPSEQAPRPAALV